MKEEEETINEAVIRSAKKIKNGVNRYFSRKAVGGQIPIDQFCEWEEYSKRCRDNGMSVCYEGFLDMLLTYNKINRALFPVANKYGYDPITFKNEVLSVFISALSLMDKTDLIEKGIVLREEVVSQIDERFKSRIDNTIMHNETKNFKKQF